MNYNILVVIVVAVFASIVLAAVAKGFRHAFQVPEGYAGLLYHKGKFAKVLSAGRHVRWGHYYTAALQDIRKTSLVVTGQEVLTADHGAS